MYYTDPLRPHLYSDTCESILLFLMGKSIIFTSTNVSTHCPFLTRTSPTPSAPGWLWHLGPHPELPTNDTLSTNLVKSYLLPLLPPYTPLFYAIAKIIQSPSKITAGTHVLKEPSWDPSALPHLQLTFRLQNTLEKKSQLIHNSLYEPVWFALSLQ